jgi:hypothetical protein
MARLSIKTSGFQETAIAIGVYTPRAMIEEVKATLRGEFQSIRSAMVANLSGGVLKRYTGDTAASVKSSIRTNATSVRASVGSRYYIARFWEDGFVLHLRNGTTRKMAPRKWAEPATAGKEQELVREIEAAVARGMARAGF